MRRPSKLQRLQRLREVVALERASFDSNEPPLTLKGNEVTAFIRQRTELYFKTWALPIIDELIEGEELKKRPPRCKARHDDGSRCAFRIGHDGVHAYGARRWS